MEFRRQVVLAALACTVWLGPFQSADTAYAQTQCFQQCKAEYEWCLVWHEALKSMQADCVFDYAYCALFAKPCDEGVETPPEDSGGSGGDEGVSHPGTAGGDCPPGWTRNTLGICEKALQADTSLAPGTHGCPAGSEPGADDRCVPIVRLGAVATADGFWVSCPGGTRPSPIDGGCVIDVQPTEREECPPRTVPRGPDDAPCTPTLRTNDFAMVVLGTWAGTGTFEREIERHVMSEMANAFLTTDIEKTVAVTAGQLGMQPVP